MRRTKTKYIAKRNELVFSTNERKFKRAWPPGDWDHWKVFGMKPTIDREKVVAHYRENYHKHAADPWEFDVAYGRVLGELWGKGIKPKEAFEYSRKGNE